MVEQDDQRKLQSLLMQIQSYQTTLQEIARQSAFTERALIEVLASINAIEELPKTKEDEALIPIGAGVFAKAQLLDKKSFIVSGGAGIHMEQTAAEAKTFLEARKVKLEGNEKMLKTQAEAIGAQLEAANKTAEDLYVQLQGK